MKAAALVRLLSVAVLAAVFVSAMGASGSERPKTERAMSSEPMDVKSDRLEAHSAEGTASFFGDVSLTQGDLRLHADEVEARVAAETRRMESLKARGHVTIEKGDISAAGNSAAYEVVAGMLTISGEATVWRDGDRLSGETIELYLAEDRGVVHEPKVLFKAERIAAQGQDSQRLFVRAGFLEAWFERGEASFKGNVVATHGDLELSSDAVGVTLEGEPKVLSIIKATGSVEIRKGDMEAFGQEAEYDISRELIVLRGAPRVRRGRDVVAGRKITLYLAEDKSVVEEPHILVYPEPDGESGEQPR